MGTTRDFCRLNLVIKLILLLSHILFSLAWAAVAARIQYWMSAALLPSLERIDFRYLKLTLLSCVLFKWISAFSCPMVFTITLLLSNLVFEGLELTVLSAIKSISSPKQRLLSGLHLMDMEEWCSWSVSCRIFSYMCAEQHWGQRPALLNINCHQSSPTWLLSSTELLELAAGPCLLAWELMGTNPWPILSWRYALRSSVLTGISDVGSICPDAVLISHFLSGCSPLVYIFPVLSTRQWSLFALVM